MRLALHQESDIVALRSRCADACLRLILAVDAEGEASFLLDQKRFGTWAGALAQIYAIEDEAARNAASFG